MVKLSVAVDKSAHVLGIDPASMKMIVRSLKSHRHLPMQPGGRDISATPEHMSTILLAALVAFPKVSRTSEGLAKLSDGVRSHLTETIVALHCSPDRSTLGQYPEILVDDRYCCRISTDEASQDFGCDLDTDTRGLRRVSMVNRETVRALVDILD